MAMFMLDHDCERARYYFAKQRSLFKENTHLDELINAIDEGICNEMLAGEGVQQN